MCVFVYVFACVRDLSNWERLCISWGSKCYRYFDYSTVLIKYLETDFSIFCTDLRLDMALQVREHSC